MRPNNNTLHCYIWEAHHKARPALSTPMGSCNKSPGGCFTLVIPTPRVKAIPRSTANQHPGVTPLQGSGRAGIFACTMPAVFLAAFMVPNICRVVNHTCPARAGGCWHVPPSNQSHWGASRQPRPPAPHVPQSPLPHPIQARLLFSSLSAHPPARDGVLWRSWWHPPRAPLEASDMFSFQMIFASCPGIK